MAVVAVIDLKITIGIIDDKGRHIPPVPQGLDHTIYNAFKAFFVHPVDHARFRTAASL